MWSEVHLRRFFLKTYLNMLKKQGASEFTTGMEEGLYVVIVLHSSQYECNFQLKKKS